MVDESILRLSPMEGLILRRTCMSAAMSESSAGGCVTTWRPLHIDLVKSLSIRICAVYARCKNGSVRQLSLEIKLITIASSAHYISKLGCKLQP